VDFRTDVPDTVSSKHRSHDPEYTKRVYQVMLLRKGGASYASIAHSLGCSEREAAAIVRREMDRVYAHIQEQASSHRQLQLERLNDMLLAQWAGRNDPRRAATLLAIMDRMDHLLGIASERLEVVDPRKNPFDSKPTEEIDAFLYSRLEGLKKPTPIDGE
jgi:DNA-binding CsgD family transcriptional regulator